MVPGTICLPIGLLIAGWSVEYKVFWAVPDIVSNCIDLVPSGGAKLFDRELF
jgi:hypothetical protein